MATAKSGVLKLYKYEFRGVVHPIILGISWSFNPSRIEMYTFNTNGLLSFNITESRILASLETEQDLSMVGLKYLGCISEIVKSGVQSVLDSYGYLTGYCFEVEFSETKTGQLEDWLLLPLEIRVIAQRTKELERDFSRLNNLLTTQNGWYLQKCISDLNKAMKMPDETGFYCYRAIETLASFFKENVNDNLEKKTWDTFRDMILPR